jgi:hypothetical protein
MKIGGGCSTGRVDLAEPELLRLRDLLPGAFHGLRFFPRQGCTTPLNQCCRDGERLCADSLGSANLSTDVFVHDRLAVRGGE